MDEQYFLKSGRIGFRCWTLNDIDLAIEFYSDPVATKFIGGVLSTAKIHRGLLTEIRLFRLYSVQYWPIFLLETNEFIGNCGFRTYMLEQRSYKFGVHIKPAFWRKGYAKEAASTAIEYAFSQLGADAIFAGHHPENVAAKELLEKMGFHNTHSEHFEPTGLYHPAYILRKYRHSTTVIS